LIKSINSVYEGFSPRFTTFNFYFVDAGANTKSLDMFKPYLGPALALVAQIFIYASGEKKREKGRK